LSNGTNDLYKFTVEADDNYGVALKTLTFAVNVSDYDGATGSLAVDTLQLVRSTDTSTALNVEIEDGTGAGSGDVGDNLETTTDNLEHDGSVQYVYLTFDDGYAEEIAAGSSRTYILKGNVSNAVTYDSITTKLTNTDGSNTESVVTDSLYTVTGADKDWTVVGDTTANDFFVWSDYSGGEASWSDALSDASSDWMNGKYVKVLPTDTQTLEK